MLWATQLNLVFPFGTEPPFRANLLLGRASFLESTVLILAGGGAWTTCLFVRTSPPPSPKAR